MLVLQHLYDTLGLENNPKYAHSDTISHSQSRSQPAASRSQSHTQLSQSHSQQLQNTAGVLRSETEISTPVSELESDRSAVGSLVRRISSRDMSDNSDKEDTGGNSVRKKLGIIHMGSREISITRTKSIEEDSEMDISNLESASSSSNNNDNNNNAVNGTILGPRKFPLRSFDTAAARSSNSNVREILAEVPSAVTKSFTAGISLSLFSPSLHPPFSPSL